MDLAVFSLPAVNFRQNPASDKILKSHSGLFQPRGEAAASLGLSW